MIHLGDITKIKGSEIPVVDCITGGSPCQDLSVAGKRAGLKGERSGLFMEQVRIVREMRERDRARGRTGYMVRPRYMVWENVPGAFSSAKGADFAAVLEEIIKVCEPGADVCVGVPDKGWRKSGCYYADDGSWSVAWRVHDAQFWGVPQRRKRIALVADFGGMSAPEVLFERKGLRWDIDEGEPAGKEAAGRTGTGAKETGGCMTGWDCQSKRIFDSDAISGTLNSGTNEGINIVPSVFCLKGNAIDRDTAQNGQWANEDVSYSLDATDRHGVAIPVNTQIATRHKALGEKTGLGIGADGDPAFTLQAGHEHGVAVLNDQGGQQINVRNDGKSPTLRAEMHGNVPCVVAFTQNQRNEVRDLREKSGALAAERGMKQQTYVVQSAGFKAGQSKAGGLGYQEECAATLSAQASGVEPSVCVAYDSGAVRTRYIVRRLTPTECARLQGFPDEWGHPDHKDDFTDEEYTFWMDVRNAHATINGKAERQYTKEQMLAWYNKLHTDSAEYRMWGNGIALPTALYVMQGIAEELTNDVI